MSELKKIRIGKFLNIISGYAFKSQHFNDEGIGLPLIRVRDINSGFAGLYYSGEYDDKFLIGNGDILVGMDGDFKCVSWNEGTALLNQRVCRLIPDETRIDKNFLLQFLPGALDEIHRKTTYTTVKHLSAKKIREIELNLPSLDTQKRIAQVLTDCEELIAKRKESIALLDELLKSIFLEMFGDPSKNPMNFKIESLKKFYLSGKEGTKCGPFGSALKRNEYIDKGIPVWNMDNISKKGKFKNPINLFVSQKKFETLKKYSTKENDIIISRAGTVGKMCILDNSLPKGIISTNLIRLRLNQGELLPVFFVSLMTYFKSRLGRLKTGADDGFTHMSTKVLDSLKFPYPPVDLQKDFALVVEKVEETKKVYQKHLRELENLYGRLSQDAFKGELDLSKVVLREEFLEKEVENKLYSNSENEMPSAWVEFEEEKKKKLTKKEVKKFQSNLRKKKRRKDITNISLADFLGVPEEIQRTREKVEFDIGIDNLFFQFKLKDTFKKGQAFTFEELEKRLHNYFYYQGDMDFPYEKFKEAIFSFIDNQPPLVEQFFDDQDAQIKLRLTDEAFKA